MAGSRTPGTLDDGSADRKEKSRGQKVERLGARRLRGVDRRRDILGLGNGQDEKLDVARFRRSCID